MRKLIAIFFMTGYLFNLAGGPLFIEYLIQKNDAAAVCQIDNGSYSAMQLIEMKVPLRVPYYSSSVKYERYYGEVELEGEYYKYVMRKVAEDTVYLLCLPDHNKSKLKQAKTTIGLMAADMGSRSASSEHSGENVKKQVSLTEYCQRFPGFDFRNFYSVSLAGRAGSSMKLYCCFIEPPVKPPAGDNQFLYQS